MNENRKCIGCGNYLSLDKNSISYTKKIDKDTKYCTRCYKLKYYGEINKFESNEKIYDKLNKIEYKDNLIIMILDLFDLENSIINELCSHENILVVVNKLASLPKNFKIELAKENIKRIIEEKNLSPIDIILYDSIGGINLKKIFIYIENATKEKKKIYFVGKTNVGKSSLINSLLKINKINPHLLCSPIKNTTLDLIKIKIGKNQLIDTPGYPNESSILNKISNNNIKKIFKSKFNNQTYKVFDENQLYFIENLFGIMINKISKEENASIVFYKNSFLKIYRMKQNKLDSFILSNNHLSFNNEVDFYKKKIELNPKNKYSIFASGIALIVISGIENISIVTDKESNYTISKNSII